LQIADGLAVLQTGGDIDAQQWGRLRIGRTKFAAIGELEAVGSAGKEGTSQFQSGIRAEYNAIGVEQEEVGGSIGFE